MDRPSNGHRYAPLLALLLSCGGGGESPTAPTPQSPPPPAVKFLVTVAAAAGITGTPAVGTQEVAAGTTISYSFGTKNGYQNLRVVIDNTSAATAGSFAVDKNRDITATADSIVQLPAASVLLSDKLGILIQDGTSKMATLRSLQTTFNEAVAAKGLEAAVQDLSIAIAHRYDPVTDAASLAKTLAEIGDSLNSETVSRDRAAANLLRFQLGAHATADAPLTTVLFINGIWNSADGPVAALPILKGMMKDLGYGDVGKYPVHLSYNSTWSAAIDAQGRQQMVCLHQVANQVMHGSVSAILKLGSCFLTTSIGALFGDLPESFFQLLNVAMGVFPPHAQPDSKALADRMLRILEQGGRIVVVAHSQGNLLAGEALGILRASPRASLLKCVGFVSIAPPAQIPVTGTGAGVTSLFAAGQSSKDILLHLPLGGAVSSVPRIKNAIATTWDDRIKALGARGFLWSGIAAGVFLHEVASSYLGSKGTSDVITTGLKLQLETVAGNCPVNTPSISIGSSGASFSAIAGSSNPASQSIQVTNGGTGTLSGLAVGSITYGPSASNWLSASLSATSAPATLTLSAVTGTLAAGTYTAAVPVTSSATGVTNSPKNITVTFAVGATTVPVASITVSPAAASITIGATQQFSATLKDASGNTLTGRTVTWSTTNPAIAIVNSSNGIASAVAAGTANITATSEEKIGSAIVSVTSGGGSTGSLTRVNAGENHTCGVTSSGTAYCWGYNLGQLGDGTTTTRNTPVLVAGNLAFSSLSGGANHTCGVTSSGTAYCWGVNFSGTLGDGTTTGRTTPVLTAGNLAFTNVSAGASHTCGVTASSTAYCWGNNFSGTLGDGTTTSRTTPVLVAGNRGFTNLSAGGSHTCGITLSGAAYCWGFNDNGQAGDGTTISRSTPVLVAGNLAFSSVSAGEYHTCGVTSSGAAYCWGANVRGQLGDQTMGGYRTTPVLVAGNIAFTNLSAGGGHTCGVTSSGAAYCWGFNANGQAGDGTTTSRSTPVLVVGNIPFASVSAGKDHTCGVTSSGAAYCWGANVLGQLGDGTTGISRLVPIVVKIP